MSVDVRFTAVIDRPYSNRAVRIFGGVEAARGRSHVAPDVIKNVAGGCGELCFARDLKSVEISASQLRLIVKHFLEMRHVPVGVDRIPVKSTTDMIVYSTSRHLSQCQQDHFQSMLPGIRIRIARVEARQKIQRDRPRKFWGTTETAFVRIKSSRKLLVSRLQNNGINFSGRSLVFGSFAQCINNVRSLPRNFCAIIFPGFGNPLQNSLESRMTKSVFRGEIGSTDKRCELWSKPYAHRPAATARCCLDESHVNAIHIGSLFTIDFNVHKLASHDVGGGSIFEGLMRHDVAPVTGGITDREKNGLVFASRFFERLLPPGKPFHRVIGVLEQVGRFLVSQSVRPSWLFQHPLSLYISRCHAAPSCHSERSRGISYFPSEQ